MSIPTFHDSKVMHLPGSGCDPDKLLRLLTDRKGHMKRLTVVVEWEDTTTQVLYTETLTAGLCLDHFALGEEARRRMFGHESQGAT